MRFSCILFFVSCSVIAQQTFSITSPDGSSKVLVDISDTIRIVIKDKESTLVTAVASLQTNKSLLGLSSRLLKSNHRSVHDYIIHPMPHKRRIIPNEYNELELQFKERFNFIVRVYNDGVAYRFKLNLKDSVIIKNEIADYIFQPNNTVYIPEVRKREGLDIFHTSFEEQYSVKNIGVLDESNVGFSPVLVDQGNTKIFLTESDLNNYPGMFLRGTKSPRIKGLFAAYPAKREIRGEGFRQEVVVERKDFIAFVSGKQSLPWRVIGIAQSDSALLMNDLVFRLASAPAEGDWSWVKPGQCTDEWICNTNLYNVPFKSGINTETYKFYIDFAKQFGIEYVMLDAGWSDNDDLFKITPGLDLDTIASYARQQGVGLCLWTLAITLDKQLESALTRFNELGVKFIMTDFMDRDDQLMTAFYSKVADAHILASSLKINIF